MAFQEQKTQAIIKVFSFINYLDIPPVTQLIQIYINYYKKERNSYYPGIYEKSISYKINLQTFS